MHFRFPKYTFSYEKQDYIPLATTKDHVNLDYRAWNYAGGDRGESALFFSNSSSKGICMLEDSTIHTCKVCTLATFHSIYMNLRLYMNAGEAKIKNHANRADSPRPGTSSPIGWGRSALFQKVEKQYMDNQKSTKKHLLFRNRGYNIWQKIGVVTITNWWNLKTMTVFSVPGEGHLWNFWVCMHVHPCVWQIGVLELNFASKDKHPEQKCQELATSNLGFEANLLISWPKLSWKSVVPIKSNVSTGGFYGWNWQKMGDFWVEKCFNMFKKGSLMCGKYQYPFSVWGSQPRVSV